MKRIFFGAGAIFSLAMAVGLAGLSLSPAMAAENPTKGFVDELFVCQLADTGDPALELIQPESEQLARGSDEHLLKGKDVGDNRMFTWLSPYDGPKRGVDQKPGEDRRLSSVDPTMHIMPNRPLVPIPIMIRV